MTTADRMRHQVIETLQLDAVARDCGADGRHDWLGEWSAANPDRAWLETSVLMLDDLVAVPDAWVHPADGIKVPATFFDAIHTNGQV